MSLCSIPVCRHFAVHIRNTQMEYPFLDCTAHHLACTVQPPGHTGMGASVYIYSCGVVEYWANQNVSTPDLYPLKHQQRIQLLGKRRRGRNMKSIRLPLEDILFINCFYRVGKRVPMPPSPDSLININHLQKQCFCT